MKHLRETFTDQEFWELKRAKAESKCKNWHDFIIWKCLPRILASQYVKLEEEVKE
jgi:hypothetical protein